MLILSFDSSSTWLVLFFLHLIKTPSSILVASNVALVISLSAIRLTRLPLHLLAWKKIKIRLQLQLQILSPATAAVFSQTSRLPQHRTHHPYINQPMRSQEPLVFIQVFPWHHHQHHLLFCSQPQEVLNIVQQQCHNTHCTHTCTHILLQCKFSQAILERERKHTSQTGDCCNNKKN
jgi:hypothetical protein